MTNKGECPAKVRQASYMETNGSGFTLGLDADFYKCDAHCSGAIEVSRSKVSPLRLIGWTTVTVCPKTLNLKKLDVIDQDACVEGSYTPFED